MTNDLYIGDVGASSFEEIDRDSRGGGENFGWPHFEGTFDPQLGYTCGIGNTFTGPIMSTRTASAPRSSAHRVQEGAPRAFPAEYEGSLFLTDFLQNWIRRLVFNGSAWVIAPPVPGQPSALNWAQSVIR